MYTYNEITMVLKMIFIHGSPHYHFLLCFYNHGHCNKYSTAVITGEYCSLYTYTLAINTGGKSYGIFDRLYTRSRCVAKATSTQ